MRHFLSSFHTTKGLLIIIGIFCGAFFIGMFTGTLPFLLAIIIFALFTVDALVTTPSKSKATKIYLWYILFLTYTPVIYETFLIAGPASGYLSAIVIIIGLPLLFIGLFLLFKSEKQINTYTQIHTEARWYQKTLVLNIIAVVVILCIILFWEGVMGG